MWLTQHKQHKAAVLEEYNTRVSCLLNQIKEEKENNTIGFWNQNKIYFQFVFDFLNGEFTKPGKYSHEKMLLYSKRGNRVKLKACALRHARFDGMLDWCCEESGKSSLMLAVENGKHRCVNILLTFGANFKITDKFEFTPLHLVVEYKGCELLLLKGADVDARNIDGITPLMMVTQHNTTECVELLIDYGASLNLKDNLRGWTALHYAAHYGSLESAQVLLEAGANFSLKSVLGNKPNDLALDSQHKETSILLSQYKKKKKL